ncbi:MAG: hypothetical protein ACI9O4_000300 [Chitinophagales bacterium]|jgi:hypothetical protein
MKNRILIGLLILGLGLITNCDNEEEPQTQYESTAVISGYDLTLCACCGGWVIELNGQATDNRFTDLPQSSNIDLINATFPLNVQLDWTPSSEYCGKGITIDLIDLI